MAAEDVPLVHLTIFLAKVGRKLPADVIQDHEKLVSFPISDDEGPLGTLFVEARSSKPPRWGSFFVPQVDLMQLGRVSSTAAVFYTTVNGRVFLLTFGQGRHLLQPACYEDQFGLRVTLNSIGENRFRSIDKHTLDSIGRHTRVQASKEAPPSEFGLDIERDLLHAVTGRPTDVSLGSTLSGLDSLHVLVRATLRSLRSLLARYLHQFGLKAYEKKFPWLNQISEVRDAVLREALDKLMLATIARQSFDKCWLAVPEIIEWDKVAGFRYGKGAKRAIVHEIDFQSFLADSGKSAGELSVEFLDRHDVTAIDDDGVEKYHWSVYRCIYCEVDKSKETYILSSGRWYRIAEDFVAVVNKFYKRIPHYDAELPEYNDATEGDYNKRLAGVPKSQFTLMDARQIPIGGGYSTVEFCDLFSLGNDLIHVKRYGGSSALSHLFSQGLVSGQLFMSDAEFRKEVNARLPASRKFADTRSRPDPRSYRIVFAVVKDEAGKSLSLPFFSRLNARQAVQTLAGYGYRVTLAKIPINEVLAKTKKFAKARSKKKGPARRSTGRPARRVGRKNPIRGPSL
jgi:uncharacterized protein (TIGR04141 family)